RGGSLRLRRNGRAGEHYDNREHGQQHCHHARAITLTMIRLHCLSPESKLRSGALFRGESAFALRRLSPEKDISVNGLGMVGGWCVSGEIRYVFVGTYVNL